MKKTDAWMPFYVGDYLADTGRLTTEGHGAYLLLILDYWRHGPLPDENESLAAITRLPLQRWLKLRPTLSGFFQVTDAWQHKRIDIEKNKANGISSERSAAGKASAEAKRQQKLNNQPTNEQTKEVTNDQQNATPSQSQSQSNPPLPSGAPPLEENSNSEKPKAKRKTQIPEDWEPDDSGVKFALDKGFSLLDVERMASQFRDHHRAKGSVFADIPAAWRTWVRNEIKFRGEKNQNQMAAVPKTPEEISAIEATRKRIEAETAERRARLEKTRQRLKSEATAVAESGT